MSYLKINDLYAGYGDIEVLHGVSLEIPKGGIFALLGPNGGGKSTLLKACAGLIQPTAGEISLNEESAQKLVLNSPENCMNTENMAQLGICLIPEGKGIFPNLTVQENLMMFTLTGETIDKVKETTYSFFPQLEGKKNQMSGTLSGGEQQMLSMSRALSLDPKLLLLDELSMGLAPIIVQDLHKIVADITKKGVTVLIVEQFAQSVLKIADKAAIMVHGQITKTGEPQSLEKELAATYLAQK